MDKLGRPGALTVTYTTGRLPLSAPGTVSELVQAWRLSSRNFVDFVQVDQRTYGGFWVASKLNGFFVRRIFEPTRRIIEGD